MTDSQSLKSIRRNVFYGSAEFTKNQPDLFLPHKFQLIAPTQVNAFLEKVKQSLIEDEFLLYVHLPFCFSECLFCNSFPRKTNRQLQQDYLESLLKEIDLFCNSGLFQGKKVKCIHFGGGTPTAFSNLDLQRILEKIRSRVDGAQDCNTTCEAHPTTLSDPNRIKGLSHMGIDRISLGCQTFDPDVLKRCNRFHTQAQIETIIDRAQEAGIKTNIDMMTGLPGQSLDSVKKDLAILDTIRTDAVEYIRHEIVNPMIIALYRENPDLVVTDDSLFEMVYLTQTWMEEHGYEQNGRFTNDKHWGYRYYWLKEMPIIAFGARSRSYTQTLCYDKHEDLSPYMRSIQRGIPPAARYIAFTHKEQMIRSLFLRLQIKSGLDLQQFQTRFHENPLDTFASLIEELSEYGCLEVDTHSLHLTANGSYFVEDVCDYIMDKILQDEPKDYVRAPHSEGRTSKRLWGERL
jgi:oxygen-independent coproporphyrinogen III oxidase